MSVRDPRSMPAGIQPSLGELIALRERVRGWPPARRGAASVSGPALSPFRGRGMEYAESRPYAPGDDARHIDWRLTARSGRTHTKLFQAERERITLVVADTAPALYFGTRTRFKSVQAARAAAIVAWAAQRSGDRIGAVRGSLRDPPIPPQGGSRGVLRVLDALTRWYAQAPDDDLGLDRALLSAARLLRPGARIVVLADAGSIESVEQGRLAALAAHHDLLVLLQVDALEIEPPHEDLPFTADGERTQLDLASLAVRAGWHHQFAARVDAQSQRLHALGARIRSLRTDDDAEVLLNALLPSAREVAA
jgi:uncharacterized protein (DUF58 family)